MWVFLFLQIQLFWQETGTIFTICTCKSTGETFEIPGKYLARCQLGKWMCQFKIQEREVGARGQADISLIPICSS